MMLAPRIALMMSVTLDFAGVGSCFDGVEGNPNASLVGSGVDVVELCDEGKGFLEIDGVSSDDGGALSKVSLGDT